MRISAKENLPGRMQFACPFRRVNARAFSVAESRSCIDCNEHVILEPCPLDPRKQLS